MSLKEVYKHIDKHKEEYVGLLQALLRQPSISGEKRVEQYGKGH